MMDVTLADMPLADLAVEFEKAVQVFADDPSEQAFDRLKAVRTEADARGYRPRHGPFGQRKVQ